MGILHILTTVPALITIYLLGVLLTWSLCLGVSNPKDDPHTLCFWTTALWPIGLPFFVPYILYQILQVYMNPDEKDIFFFRGGWIRVLLAQKRKNIMYKRIIKEAKSKPVQDTLEQTFTELEKIK